MPDTERLLRSAQTHFAKPGMKPILTAEFRGEDRARWQIAKVFAGLAIAAIIAAWIIGR